MNRTSHSQYETMLDYMVKHGDMAHPTSGSQAKDSQMNHWEILKDHLNADGSGCAKTVKKWQKVWADWKYNTKKKGANNRININRTGGGVGHTIKLTDLEDRLLGFMGTELITGNGAPEAGLIEPTPQQEDSLEIVSPPLSVPSNSEGNQMPASSVMISPTQEHPAPTDPPQSSTIRRRRKRRSHGTQDEAVAGAGVGAGALSLIQIQREYLELRRDMERQNLASQQHRIEIDAMHAEARILESRNASQMINMMRDALPAALQLMNNTARALELWCNRLQSDAP